MSLENTLYAVFGGMGTMTSAQFLHTHFIFIFLFFIGLLAGTVDAIAGGGGLISLPMLLSIGLPPQLALGTNKLQTSIGTSVATYRYYKNGWISFKTVFRGLIFGLIGAVFGALLSQHIGSQSLSKFIVILLVAILGYTLYSPSLGMTKQDPRMKESYCFGVFGLLLGFYDGFFGPGTGSIWVFVLTYFLGYDFSNATAYTKVFNLKSNIFATICFIVGGFVNYHIAICMAAGQLIGGFLGAQLTISNGAKLVRPIFLVMVVITIISLAYKTFIG